MCQSFCPVPLCYALWIFFSRQTCSPVSPCAHEKCFCSCCSLELSDAEPSVQAAVRTHTPARPHAHIHTHAHTCPLTVMGGAGGGGLARGPFPWRRQHPPHRIRAPGPDRRARRGGRAHFRVRNLYPLFSVGVGLFECRAFWNKLAPFPRDKRTCCSPQPPVMPG